jgi:hypothetical protein
MTTLGTIVRPNDGEDLAYKGLELNMTNLKRFVALQAEAAQKQLNELLLVHPEEELALAVLPLSLRTLKDDPSNSQPGWNFLKDQWNKALQGQDRWLLTSVDNNIAIYCTAHNILVQYKKSDIVLRQYKVSLYWPMTI